MQVLGESEEGLYRRFQAEYESGNINACITTLKRLAEIAPDNIYYKERLAWAYEYNGQKDAAVGIYKEILKVDPTNARANIAMAENKTPELAQGEKLSSIMGFVKIRTSL